jgi:hypothetical protein
MIRRLKRQTKRRHSARAGRGFVVHYHPVTGDELRESLRRARSGDMVFLAQGKTLVAGAPLALNVRDIPAGEPNGVYPPYAHVRKPFTLPRISKRAMREQFRQAVVWARAFHREE